MELSSDSLLYILYTSGSTGTPKGVCITHGNVAELLDSCSGRFRFSEEDCWTLFHSHAFDLSVWEMWGALLYGGRLALVPFAISRSPADFWDLLNRTETTILTQTPSAFRSLISEAVRPDAKWSGCLRLVVFAGEALEFGMLARWTERYSLEQTRLVNMYGITETTVHVTAHEITAAEIAEGWPSWIGGAIDHWSVHIIDSAMHPAPDGLPGEIFVGGAGLARAYHGRPDLTADRFVPDPFGGFGQRLYRSGDLAVRLGSGQVSYLGRGDGQVKIRGHRIELGEVEAALRSAPGVQEVAVVATREESGARLLAYIVARETASGEQVREHASRHVPAYMMPAAIMKLERLPLTINGKLDRASLPMPGAVSEAATFVEPRNDRERQLAVIWSKVLGLRSIGIHDNFFHSGGDSIRAMQVVSQTNSQFQRQLPIRSLYDAPSIESFSRLLDTAAPPANPIARAERTPLVRKVTAE